MNTEDRKVDIAELTNMMEALSFVSSKEPMISESSFSSCVDCNISLMTDDHSCEGVQENDEENYSLKTKAKEIEIAIEALLFDMIPIALILLLVSDCTLAYNITSHPRASGNAATLTLFGTNTL
jgi:hypothetical protein